ncbi:MAG TPA: HAMP domain-containing sensor histidine kinase [Alphaproteobacteria bacterium]|jgi:signal transduction histidine kinase|nr:HAMP domain-containing sensor histidine kinase [Alphaproteobacteria bacterium]
MPTDLGPSSTFRLQRLKLGTQLLLALTVLSVMVGFITASAVRNMEYRYLREAMTEDRQQKFDLLIESSLDNLIAEDVPRLQTIVMQLVAHDDTVHRVMIRNENGIPLVAWQRQGLIDDESRLSFSRQVMFHGQTFGRVAIEWNGSAADREATRHAYLLAAIAGGACLTLSLLVYAVMTGLVVGPIHKIVQRLDEFRQDRLTSAAPLPAGQSLEVATLTASVNALGDYIIGKRAHAAELARARDNAEIANRAKTEFLANISHDLRTPLNAINGFSEMMEMQIFGPLGDDRYAEYVKHIHRSGTHLLSLINDILDVSKLEAGKFELQIERVDLKSIIELSLALLSDHADRSAVRIVTHIDAKLPPANADGRRLQQIMLNLLSNAVKFTPPGGTVTVSASWHPAYGSIVSVSDTGIGIPPEKIQTALEPFGQVENALTRRFQGTGLGLPLAKAFVELHGGELQIESHVDKGTVVKFSLPASLFVAAPPASRPAPKETPAAAAPPQHNSPQRNVVAGRFRSRLH